MKAQLVVSHDVIRAQAAGVHRSAADRGAKLGSGVGFEGYVYWVVGGGA